MVDRKNGFSLIEVLIVLAIFSSVIGLALPSAVHTVQQMQGQQFIEKLSADLYAAASEAISYRASVQVVVWKHNQFYTIQRMWELKRKKIAIPPGFTVVSNFASGTISFNDLGHVMQAGTIFITYPTGQKKRITVYMASGRFQVSAE
ncbi:competence type IV pilus minor pilin ComGD [Aneurinibacillus sp. REN35]|uniref:competence type IV pilus minor pilin ComGD n=1 Tax=Aneurinibacillus sp. REN35 TaxID=3237286 RepID=UPI003528AF65